jgi:hypothetical protein
MRLRGLLATVLVSCAGPGEASGPPERDFRGIIHCHSLYSHDSKGTYPEILAAARAAGIDFVCMTDHPPKDDPGRPLREGWTGVHEGVLFIQGAEYGDQILALGIREPVHAGTPRERIRAIHAQGALAFACHPEEIEAWEEYQEADGMEIFNVHASLKSRSYEPVFLGLAAKILREDPEHCYRLLQRLDRSVLERWDRMNEKRLFAGIAGNDAHQNVNLLGVQVDPYPRAFRFVTTHVRARELTERAILSALREARAYVLFEIQGPPGPGPFEIRSGKEERGPWMEVRGLNPPPSGPTLEFYGNGERLPAGGSPGARLELARPGSYRVVGTAESDDGVRVPWILSNPVRIRD